MGSNILQEALRHCASIRLSSVGEPNAAYDAAKFAKGLRYLKHVSGAIVTGVNVSDSSGSGPNRYGQLRVWDNAKATGWCRLLTKFPDPETPLGSPDISTYEVEESPGSAREVKVKTFTGMLGERAVDMFPSASLPSVNGQAAKRLAGLGVPSLTALVERSPWYKTNKALSEADPVAEAAGGSHDVSASGLLIEGRQSGSALVKGKMTGNVYRTEYGNEYEVTVSYPTRDSGKKFRLLPKDFQGTIANEHFVDTESCTLRISNGGHMVSEFPGDPGRPSRAYHSLEEWLSDNKGLGTSDDASIDTLRSGGGFVKSPVRGVTMLRDDRARGATLQQEYTPEDSRGNLVRPSGTLTGGYFWVGQSRVVELTCSDHGKWEGEKLAVSMADFTGRVTHRSGRGWVDYSDGKVGAPQGDLASIGEDNTQEELSF